MLKKSILTALLVTVTAVAAHAAPTAVDSKIAKYKSASGVAGNLGSIGSDTLNNLMTYWAEGFKKKGSGDKKRFLNIAQGSLEETRYYLVLIADLGYGDIRQTRELLIEVSKLLDAYMNAILTTGS